MTNTIYFGIVDPGQDTDYETCFSHNNYWYYYKLEWDESFELRIVDTCGRYVPFDASALGDLKRSINMFYKELGGREAYKMAGIVSAYYENPINQAMWY